MNYQKALALSSLIFAAGGTHAAISLDFSGYAAGTQPASVISGTSTVYDGQTGMLYTDVANAGTSGVGIDAIIRATSTYFSGNSPSKNGISAVDDAAIVMLKGTTTSFELQLYDAGTLNPYDGSGSPFAFDLVFYDVDASGTGSGFSFDSFLLRTPGTYTLATGTILTATQTAEGLYVSGENSGSVPSPSNTDNLTAAEERVSIIVNFTNKNKIVFDYIVGGPATSGDRILVMDADDFTVFDDAGGQPPVGFVPEPSAYALLAGCLGLVAVMLRRRERR